VNIRYRIAAAVLLALVGAACASPSGSSAPQESVTVTDDPAVVTIADLAFSPAQLTVDAGATVQWTWADAPPPHDVAGDSFRSHVQDTGTSTHRFDDPGTYEHVCTLHPNITGTIEVVAT
jgi:plastocyanin